MLSVGVEAGEESVGDEEDVEATDELVDAFNFLSSSILVSIIDESSSTEKLLLLELVTSEVADSGVGI